MRIRLNEGRRNCFAFGEDVPTPTPGQLRQDAGNKFTVTVVFVANWIFLTWPSRQRQEALSEPCS